MEESFINGSMQKMLHMPKWSSLLRLLFEWQAQLDDEEDEVELPDVAKELLEEAGERLRSLGVGWLDVFREVEKRGAGRLILGRHGRSTRFKWSEPAAAFAQRALNLMNDSASPIIATIAEKADAASLSATPSLVIHNFPLRHDLHVQVQVPADVTREELTRLAEFTRLLPSKS